MFRVGPEIPRTLVFACLALSLSSCGPDGSADGAPDEQEPASETAEEPRSLAEIADTRCASPELVWDREAEEPWRLGEGYQLIDHLGAGERGRPTGMQCVGDNDNRLVERAVDLDARVFLVENPDDGHAKMGTLLQNDLSRIDWAQSEVDYFDDFFEDGAVPTADGFGHADESSRVLVLAVFARAAHHTLQDSSVTYADSDRLRYVVSYCGTAFTRSMTYGGAFLAMADISTLPRGEQDALEDLLDQHAPDGRAEVESFASAFEDLGLSEVRYWTRTSTGLGFDRVSIFGRDLEGLVSSLPSLEEELAAKVDEAIEREEYRHSDMGAVLDTEKVAYSDEQIETMGLSEADAEQYTCFRDFTVEARSLLESSNRYASEALCRRKVYDLQKRTDEHNRAHARYQETWDQLGDIYLELRDLYDDCEQAVIREGQGSPCEICQIPEALDQSAIEAIYADM